MIRKEKRVKRSMLLRAPETVLNQKIQRIVVVAYAKSVFKPHIQKPEGRLSDNFVGPLGKCLGGIIPNYYV